MFTFDVVSPFTGSLSLNETDYDFMCGNFNRIWWLTNRQMNQAEALYWTCLPADHYNWLVRKDQLEVMAEENEEEYCDE